MGRNRSVNLRARDGDIVAAAQEDHDLSTMLSVIDAETGAETDSQLKDAAAHGFGVAEVSGAHAGQTSIHRRLHFWLAEGIEPLVKRDQSVLKFQLPDLPLDHRRSVIYR